MNSGLPSLLDAIFGKRELDSVSLDEIYELIQEFPSFNAGHFLLSKKLKGQNESDYERETKRTALYFNNPFWLESVLSEENLREKEIQNPVYPGKNGDDLSLKDSFANEPVTILSEIIIEEQSAENEEDEEFGGIREISLENLTTMPGSFQEEHSSPDTRESPQFIPEEKMDEYDSDPVKSFDDLISKYRIEAVEEVNEYVTESVTEISRQTAGETPVTEQSDSQDNRKPDVFQIPVEKQADAESDDFIPEEAAGSYEMREEVINEYGIFEEVIVKKSDFDLEVFDRSRIQPSGEPEKLGDMNPAEEQPAEKDPESILFSEEIPEPLPENIVENPFSDPVHKKRAEADYEAFDRPIDNKLPEDIQDETESRSEMAAEEESITEIYSGQENRLESVESGQGADDTGNNELSSPEEDNSGNRQMPGLAARFEEQQKIRAAFDPKKAESIVFAPYHMIDYFASQGIKLVLEENPPDAFGKQLKSFTDWLKVMKKIPASPLSDKADEKEVDRIRHFAAHSIDEREILTESMAEVLAKQGMYENAIALYLKLSLIYPPKSAYFASRIEQLKASLP